MAPKARELGVRLLCGIVFIFAIGAVGGGVELIFGLLTGRALPRWSPLTYVGVAFAIGFAYFIGGVLWHPIGKVLVDRDKVTDPLWKRSARLLAIFAILALMVLCAILIDQYGWIPQWLR